jgi:reductive dehalogenase
MCVPVAADAGLGELGRIGLLITRPYGPRVRLSVVTTDLPLVPDRPRTFGVQHFCRICMKCAEVCPSGSIDRGEKSLQAGTEKWQSRQDGCYHYWRIQGSDCSLCVRACPFSHPDSTLHNLVRGIIANNALSHRLLLRLDDWFYGRIPAPDRFQAPDWHARD